MRMILAAALVAALSGCAVYPAGYYHEGGYRDGAAVLTYPEVPSAYYWEPSVNLWYFHSPRGRYYMHRGWNRDRDWNRYRGRHDGWRHR